MTRRAWSIEEDQKLVDLLAKGKSKAFIARAIKRSESSVHSRTGVLEARTRPATKKPGEKVMRPIKTKRTCLCCHSEFLSDGPHNRLCSTCRRIEKTCFDF